MPDMKKVKKALEYCDNSEDCRGCVYWEETLHINDCPVNRYALELLKEQEAEIEKLTRYINGFSRDAIPVVRCKDCINCVKEPNGELYCDILAVGYEPLGSKKVNANWFCADGEHAES